MNISITDLIPFITALSALISAIAAAFWGRGLAIAKNETIKAKEAQIEALRTTQEQLAKIKEAQIESLLHEIETYRQLTPNKIREYFVSVKQQLEEYNEVLNTKLQDAQQVISYKEEQLALLRAAQELQQSSIESEVASGVTVTLEGWARSVELRSGDAEGHTQRLADMTVQLAKIMGVSEDEIINIKRGAVLHDVGKITIPDKILQKAGKLTDNEWVVFKQHPESAYNLLYPIEYLRPALNIPYCHHERWDGTGYPRGLKGEEIPFAARIFTVVDVWDSLRSDRIYRSGWPKEKVIQFIREQAGKGFDPKVVNAFVKLVQQSSNE